MRFFLVIGLVAFCALLYFSDYFLPQPRLIVPETTENPPSMSAGSEVTLCAGASMSVSGDDHSPVEVLTTYKMRVAGTEASVRVDPKKPLTIEIGGESCGLPATDEITIIVEPAKK